MRGILTAVALSLATISCGAGPSPSGGLVGRNSNVLSAEEIRVAGSAGWTAYDIIAQLRPQFLRSRGPTSLRTIKPTTAVVYVDDLRFGDLNSLRTISASQVYYIQYVSASDATTRFGSDHTGGAILITTK